MPFKIKSARYHPLYGLRVTDDSGTEFDTCTKKSFLAAGFVSFIWFEDAPCPYRIQVPPALLGGGDAKMMDGTSDPDVLALARAAFNGFPGVQRPKGDDWFAVPVG